MTTYIGRNDGQTYDYSNGILRISGSGQVTDLKNGQVVTTVNGENVLINIYDVREVYFESGITSINRYATLGSNCAALTKLVMADTVTEVLGDLCNSCRNLSDLTLSNNLTRLEYGTFQSCTSLEYVQIPASLTYIYGFTTDTQTLNAGSPTAFGGLTNLKGFIVDSGNQTYCSENGILYSKDKNILWRYPSNPQPEIRNYTVGSPTTVIAYGAFDELNKNHRENTDSTNITIESGVSCGTLTASSSRIYKIGLGQYTHINKLTIPIDTKIRFISSGTPSEDIGLCKILEYTAGETGVGPAATTDTTNPYTYFPTTASRKSLKEIIFDEGVTQLSKQACAGLSLTTNLNISVVLPTTLTGVGDQAFRDSIQIKNIEFRGNAPTIGSNAFDMTSSSATLAEPNIYTHGGWGRNTIEPTISSNTRPSYYNLYAIEYNTENVIDTEYQKENVQTTLPDRVKDQYFFRGWWTAASGGTKIGDPGQTVTFSSDTLLYAHFDNICHIDVSSDGNGTVSGGGDYIYGTTVNITATPAPHYHFLKWSDDNTNAIRTLSATEEVSLVAYFEIDRHTIIARPADNHGSVTGGGTYDYGTTITLTAIPSTHYHLVEWNDGSTELSRTITVTEDAEYSASFAIDRFTLTLVADGNGAVSGGGTYDYGTIVEITASPDRGYHFLRWSDGSTQEKRSFKITRDLTLTATFLQGSERTIGSYITLTANDYGEEKTIHFSVFNEEMNSEKCFSTILTDYSDMASTNVLVTPIVTYTAENAFAFDVSPNDILSIQFTRVNPKGTATYWADEDVEGERLPLPWNLMGDDRMWSNRVWENNLMSLINRWQAESNGCILRYHPINPDTQYNAAYNVFIKSITFDHNASSPEMLKGTIDLQVGSMTGDAKVSDDYLENIESEFFDKVMFNDMIITMTDSRGITKYTIFDKGSYNTYEPYINFTKVEDYIGFYIRSGTDKYRLVTAANCKESGLITIDQIDLSKQTVAFFRNNINCISKYSLKGGPEQSFPFLKMEISKRRLSAVAPDLLNDIYAGFNKIEIEAMGADKFIVTKCSSSSTTYTITAYSIYEMYRSAKLDAPIQFASNSPSKTPYEIIISILSGSRDFKYGSSTESIYCISGENGNIKYAYRNSKNSNAFIKYLNHPTYNNVQNYGCTFDTNSSAWYVISVCAAMINCKVWFSNNNVYIVDTSISYNELLSAGSVGSDISTNLIPADETKKKEATYIPRLYLNTNNPYPLSISAEEKKFVKTVCDEITLGDEGVETVVNSVFIEFDSSKDPSSVSDTAKNLKITEAKVGSGQTRTGIYCNDNAQPEHWYTNGISSNVQNSQQAYGIREQKFTIEEFGNIQAQNLVDTLADAYCDSEQSVGFSLRETHFEDKNAKTGKYWRRYFPEVTYVDMVVDYSHDLMLTTKSNFIDSATGRSVMPNKLTLSTYEYHFPEGNTEYWFGIMKPTDLTQNTREISATLYKR